MSSLFKELNQRGFKLEARSFSNLDGSLVSKEVINDYKSFCVAKLYNTSDITTLIVTSQDSLELAYDLKTAKFLILECGVSKFYRRYHSHTIATIGQDLNGSWYGWSHRAIRKFGLGDPMFISEDHEFNSQKLRSLSAAKRSAINFAEYIS